MAAKKWIQAAHIEKGALHRALHIPEGKAIPEKVLAKAEKRGGKVGKMARLAETLKGFHN